MAIKSGIGLALPQIVPLGLPDTSIELAYVPSHNRNNCKRHTHLSQPEYEFCQVYLADVLDRVVNATAFHALQSGVRLEVHSVGDEGFSFYGSATALEHHLADAVSFLLKVRTLLNSIYLRDTVTARRRWDDHATWRTCTAPTEPKWPSFGGIYG